MYSVLERSVQTLIPARIRRLTKYVMVSGTKSCELLTGWEDRSVDVRPRYYRSGQLRRHCLLK
jgi:hypothetical protein